jgi:pimeloyl-ACP methyl ester carboxylesterase
MKLVVFCHGHPDGDRFDPDPQETMRRGVELGRAAGNGPFAAVGWRVEGLAAAHLAATMPSRVDRLVLCCVPAPTDVDPGFDPRDITAKTLLLFGQKDPDAPAKHARWWKDRIQSARVEMVPDAGSDIIEALWKRTLSHAAPKAPRS